MNETYALAVHGGAGTIRRSAMSAEPDGRIPCRAAPRAGRPAARFLAAGGSALDAVTAAVVALEDDPLFNAGRGAVFTAAGTQEMDAAVMDGRDRRAGAVAGIFGPKNPVLAARAVMEHSPHVLLIGDGALAFCREHGARLRRARIFPHRSALAGAAADPGARAAAADDRDDDEARRHGTVGAVARDRERQSRRRHLDRRDDRQIAGPGRRQPDHRRRHLCRQRDLRDLGDRPRRILHPLRRRARGRGAPAPSRRRSRRRRRARSSPNSAGSAAPAGSSRSAATARWRCRSTAPACIAALSRADGVIHTAIYDEPYRTGEATG